MQNNLAALTEKEMEKYMNLNDNVVKNMIRLHGTNNLNNVFNVKKQKFLERVVQDHNYKKNKVGEFIKSMSYHDDVLRLYQKNLAETEDTFKIVNS